MEYHSGEQDWEHAVLSGCSRDDLKRPSVQGSRHG